VVRQGCDQAEPALRSQSSDPEAVHPLHVQGRGAEARPPHQPEGSRRGGGRWRFGPGLSPRHRPRTLPAPWCSRRPWNHWETPG